MWTKEEEEMLGSVEMGGMNFFKKWENIKKGSRKYIITVVYCIVYSRRNCCCIVYTHTQQRSYNKLLMDRQKKKKKPNTQQRKFQFIEFDDMEINWKRSSHTSHCILYTRGQVSFYCAITKCLYRSVYVFFLAGDSIGWSTGAPDVTKYHFFRIHFDDGDK
jgi:hypothetical protein